LLETVYLGNSLWHWLIALAIAAAAFAVTSVIRRFILKKFGKRAQLSGTPWDDILVVLAQATKPLFLAAVAGYLGTRVLTFPARVGAGIGKMGFLALLIQLAVWGGSLMTFWIERLVKAKAEDGGHTMTVRTLGFVAKLVFFSVVLLWGLDNLGVNVTALVTGLGVGGIAVALATQNILSDLFASLSIVLDKPFVIGDYIVVGGLQGTIENIGLKTTRVRSLSGEQIIFSNADLLQSRIQNFRRMRERRIEFGLVFSTTPPRISSSRCPVSSKKRSRTSRRPGSTGPI
jgi:small-conductance mechanosensitive channel